jgi:hypothetical protein
LLGVLLLSVLSVKLILAGALLQPARLFEWLNRNVLVALLLGGALLVVLLRLKRGLQAAVGLLAMCAAQVVVYVWPLEDGGTAELLRVFRVRLHLQDFHGLVTTLLDIWPWVTALFFMRVLWVVWRTDENQIH